MTVPSVPLASALAAHKPTVLVSDAEGAETELLTDANLDGVRAILVETHANVSGQNALDGMIESLERSGFAVTRNMHRNLLLTKTEGPA